MQGLFAATRELALGIVLPMDAKAIGERIREARRAVGHTSTARLASELSNLLARKKGGAGRNTKSSITRQTVDNWESGQVPPWDKISLLAEAFGPPYDEEWILFGKRRADQLAAEQPVLEHVSTEEWQLLQEYRHATEEGRKAIVSSARGIRHDHPLPLAQVRSVGPKPA